MKIVAADLDEAFSSAQPNSQVFRPACDNKTCFVGSYAPVSKAGEDGPFNVNTTLLQPNRYAETVGTVPVRSADFK